MYNSDFEIPDQNRSKIGQNGVLNPPWNEIPKKYQKIMQKGDPDDIDLEPFWLHSRTILGPEIDLGPKIV